MLYCPKCQATYEEGNQRFCTNEGVRLLPLSTSKKTSEQPLGVFSSILGKSFSTPDREKSDSTESEVAAEKVGQSKIAAFTPPGQSKFFKGNKNARTEELEVKTEIDIISEDSPEKPKTAEPLPLAQIINPSNIPEKQSKFDELFTVEPSNTAEELETIPAAEPILTLEPIEPESVKATSAKDPLEFNEPIALEAELQIPPDNPIETFPSEKDELELNLDEFELFDEDELEEQPATETTTDDLADLAGFAEEIESGELDFFPVEDEKNLGSEEEFQLNLEEPTLTPVAEEIKPDFELEFDGIDETPVPVDPVSPIETVDPVSPFELEIGETEEAVAETEALSPQIELDLDGLDEVEAEESEPDKISSDLKDPDSEEAIPKPLELEAVVEDKISVLKTEEVVEETPEPKKVPTMVTAPSETTGIKATSDLAWEKRSENPVGKKDSNWYLPVIIGLVILVLGAVGLMYLMNPKQQNDSNLANIAPNLNPKNVSVVGNINAVVENNINGPIQELPIEPPMDSSAKSPVDSPPQPRPVTQPPNTVFYQNKKSSQKGELAKQFIGFSIYYPKDWKENKADNKFLDISKTTPEGFPIKSFLVSRYDSKGVYSEDLNLFDELVEKSNKDLKDILTNYQVISQGETTIQNGRWKAYEVKFQGLISNKKLILWGRRLWIPIQKKGMKSGFIITMFATSLADDVNSVEDIGVKGELATILNTFEPDRN